MLRETSCANFSTHQHPKDCNVIDKDCENLCSILFTNASIIDSVKGNMIDSKVLGLKQTRQLL